MLMLIHCLGPEYIVWDKAASIRFRRPGRTQLTATFRLEDAELQAIRDLLQTQPKVDRSYTIELVDHDGLVYAVVEKVVHIAQRA
jgi:hypothetical protein